MTLTVEVTFMVYGQNGVGRPEKRVMELTHSDYIACTSSRKNETMQGWAKNQFPSAKKVNIQTAREIKPVPKKKTSNSNSIIGGAIAGVVVSNVAKKSKKDNNKENTKAFTNEKFKKSINTGHKTIKNKEKSPSPIKSLLAETGRGILDDFKRNSATKREKEFYYSQKKEEIYELLSPQTTAESIEQIDSLLLRINDESWSNKNGEEHKNEYTDLCYEKLKQLVNRLPHDNPNYPHYKKKIKGLRFKRFFKKNLG